MRSFAKCHPDKTVAGRGLCKSCYQKALYSENTDHYRERGRAGYHRNRVKRLAAVNRYRKDKRERTIRESKKCVYCGEQFVPPPVRGKRIYCPKCSSGSARNRMWRIRHPGARREYYDKNADRLRAYTRKWGILNAIRKQAAAREYRKKNLDRCRLKGRQRNYENRARLRNATVGNPIVIIEWEKRWRGKACVRCFWCQKAFSPGKCHADHIIALARGGTHEISNLCISCARCNIRKNAKQVQIWNAQIESPVLL